MKIFKFRPFDDFVYKFPDLYLIFILKRSFLKKRSKGQKIQYYYIKSDSYKLTNRQKKVKFLNLKLSGTDQTLTDLTIVKKKVKSNNILKSLRKLTQNLQFEPFDDFVLISSVLVVTAL